MPNCEIQKKIKDCDYFSDNVFLARLANVYVNMNFLATQLSDSGADSTDAEVLKELALKHEVPQLVLDIRQKVKIKSTYL